MPQLNFPDDAVKPGPRQMHIYGTDGKLVNTVTYGPDGKVSSTSAMGKAKEAFNFKKLLEDVRGHSNPIKVGLSTAGFGVAGTVLMLAVVSNLGNPVLFSDRREEWKAQLEGLKGAAWDVWLSYFSDVAPAWRGHAVEIFQQYLRFKLIGMFDQLAAIAKEMSGTMNNQYKEVLTYDFSALALAATAAPVFRALLKFSAHPVGRVALLSQSVIFLGAAANMVKQFADTFNKYQSELNDLELKLTDLTGIFYLMGNPAVGPRELHMDPNVTDIKLWTPLEEDKK